MSRRKLIRAWSDLVDEMRAKAFNEQADLSALLPPEDMDEVISLDDALEIADKHLTALALGPVDRLRSRLPWSRPCYNKPHRCPGWVGGGWTSAMVNRCPDGGSLSRIDFRRRYWHGARCPECKLYVLPIVTKWLDPSWWKWSLAHPQMPHWLWRMHPRLVRNRWRKRRTGGK